jgi:hypothetical protein
MEDTMSLTYPERLIGQNAAYGGFVDAAGGIASVVLAIIGLAGTASETMIAIAVIIFGAALLIQGGTLLSEYARIMFPPGGSATVEQFGGGSLSAVFLAGAAGIVLGILALLGLNPTILTAAAIIAFGAALVLSSNSVWHLHLLKRSALRSQREAGANEILANEMAFGSASLQALAGLAGVVLGIIGLAGSHTVTLTLVALLALGGTLILTGSTLSATVMSFMRPAPEAPESAHPQA